MMKRTTILQHTICHIRHSGLLQSEPEELKLHFITKTNDCHMLYVSYEYSIYLADSSMYVSVEYSTANYLRGVGTQK